MSHSHKVSILILRLQRREIFSAQGAQSDGNKVPHLRTVNLKDERKRDNEEEKDRGVWYPWGGDTCVDPRTPGVACRPRACTQFVSSSDNYAIIATASTFLYLYADLFREYYTKIGLLKRQDRVQYSTSPISYLCFNDTWQILKGFNNFIK